MDIYHLPFPGGSDRRLGTFYRPDGTAQRVNGRITGNQIEFYLDPDQANSAITALKGMYFAGYLFSYDRAYMAGRMKDSRDGNTYSFYATKAAALSGKARQGVFTPASYLGYWKMNHDGWVGDLAIEKVNVKTGGVTGHYSSAGVTSPVRGRIDLATMLFTFTVQSSRPQSFWMSILSHERGIMAGTTNWAGFTFGAWAQRTADGGMTTLANIGPPVSNDEGFPPVCKKKPYLPQCNN